MGVRHTVVHKDVHTLLVVGIDFVLQAWAHIHIGFAGTLDQMVPAKCNLGWEHSVYVGCCIHACFVEECYVEELCSRHAYSV